MSDSVINFLWNCQESEGKGAKEHGFKIFFHFKTFETFRNLETDLVLSYRYTNADLKICLYLRLHGNIICRKFHIITPFTF